MTNHTPPVSRSANRAVGMTFGTLYLVVGGLGFFFPGSGGFFSIHGQGGLVFGLFEVDPFHNVVHIMIGSALLIAAQSLVSAAKTVNKVTGVLLLVLGLAGFFLVDSPLNILALNQPDNLLHLVSGGVLLALSILTEKDARRAGI